ncbi:anhydro-N-acetylmuramic acid kinase-like [Dreissena polymorpha]|uniref:Anhydro-N-acetylmuramic acid kinase n=1 Tax=Dreissena polymorpha TaxID=45954 RepID=A0A9D4K8U5_DREPO|nr:anhydro-N-acetylmuramic acid kinase-like [Dreissena polymorpha]KAH3835253.1 hypothetical protein DPMN_108601 [Dreissena polymorpha]
MSSFVGIGCMSGSSLDGLDVCCVEFTGDICSDLWGYRILNAETISYDEQWTERLRNAAMLSAAHFVKVNVDYGLFVGHSVARFITKHRLDHKVQFVASHGHSLFHNPHDGVAFQLGDGEVTATVLKVPFVTSFRSKDVCLGGQGAPLVPCGEKFLFRNSDICVNLGGIANIGVRGLVGYDICACNIMLNYLASKANAGMAFDKDGELARNGNVIPEVLLKLKTIAYYQDAAPKSLWRDYIESNIMPILDTDKYIVVDLLRTCTEHVASMVAKACLEAKNSLATALPGNAPTVLITGGGALNKFLMENIRQLIEVQGLVVQEVDEETINFKEALIFAFLGMRCLLGVENVFRETTGARKDSVSGSIHRPATCPALKNKSLLH